MKNINLTIDRLIYNVLTLDIEARDNWMRTIKIIHETEMTLKGIGRAEYFVCFFNEEFTNIHTIKRRWSAIQTEYPKLRGAEYDTRQKQGGQFVLEIDPSQMTMFDEQELSDLAMIKKPTL